LYLSSLQVENFRAIRSARLEFDQTTVLIGENDCGKTSLLNALSKVLDDDIVDKGLRFDAQEFHYEEGGQLPLGPIRIRLGFQEREAGEWSTEVYKPIASLLLDSGKKPRKLDLEISANPVEQGESTAELKLQVPGSKNHATDPGMIHWLLKMNPLIRVSSGMLTGHGVNHEPDDVLMPDKDASSAGIESQLKRISTSTSSLLSGHSKNMAGDLEEGFSAARELIKNSGNHFSWGRHAINRAIEEILGREQPEEKRPIILNESGSYSERLGVLLLVAALLREHPEGFLPHAEPIWVVEDPEAHLHPMTLTSVALMLGHIKWQKIITTHSGDLLATLPLRRVRRLMRYQGLVHQYRVREHALSLEDLRRLGYHQRAHNGVASFARLWLLVEGESEFWVVPQIARLMGYEFALEGISCIEFAQCGLEPLVKAAKELGIEWHLLADGDDAGRHYIESAREFLRGDEEQERLTLLSELDIEHCFWHNGFSQVYEHYSRMSPSALQQNPPKQVIRQAVKNRSKPYLALSVVEAFSEPDAPGIPAVLQRLVKTCVGLAREAPARHAAHNDESSNQRSIQSEKGDGS